VCSKFVVNVSLLDICFASGKNNLGLMSLKAAFRHVGAATSALQGASAEDAAGSAVVVRPLGNFTWHRSKVTLPDSVIDNHSLSPKNFQNSGRVLPIFLLCFQESLWKNKGLSTHVYHVTPCS
jgi:hypothetical protein